MGWNWMLWTVVWTVLVGAFAFSYIAGGFIYIRWLWPPKNVQDNDK